MIQHNIRWKQNFNTIMKEIKQMTDDGIKFSKEFQDLYTRLFEKQRYTLEDQYLDYYNCAYIAHKLLSKIVHALLDDGEIYYALLMHNDDLVDQKIIFDKQPQIYLLTRNFINKRAEKKIISESDFSIINVDAGEFMTRSVTL